LVGAGAITADNAADLVLTGLTIDGSKNTSRSPEAALVNLNTCTHLHISDIAIEGAPSNAIKLWRCSGHIEHCRFNSIAHTAIKSGNAIGLEVSHNRIDHAGNNGIVIWRDKAGPDGTSVNHNHIANVRSDAGGSGQNGNAINAFRAANVILASNVISDCAYSAVRCNAASNAQIISNNCRNIGEVALYAEFAFEGAIIANNIVDGAATGIEVTNFNTGGRLATVQANIIRNLFRREHEPVDKRGVGIAVEADTIVSANTIENAPSAGITIGWGKWMRHVIATGNLIQHAAIGITVSAAGMPNTVMITNNIMAHTTEGGVRLTDHQKPIGPPLENGQNSNARPVLHGNLMS
jgi:uncharacterized secreted repeat protein (TIGR03808 family)